MTTKQTDTTGAAAAAALLTARDHENSSTEAGYRYWLTASGTTTSHVLAGRTVNSLHLAHGANLRDAQTCDLAGLAMSKSYTPSLLAGPWDTLPVEWAPVWDATRRAFRSIEQGGCGAKAAREAIGSCGTAATVPDALNAAISKAKTDKSKADAEAKAAAKLAELGTSGILAEDVARLAKAIGKLSGREGWTTETLNTLLVAAGKLGEITSAVTVG